MIENIELLRNAFRYVMRKYSFEIYACNILKDHMHIIFKLENSKDYSEIIRLIKYYFSIHFNKFIQPTESKIRKREKGIWQRRYWEHTIRNENDLNRHLDYIHYNSYKHYKINPQDWEYSSFKKFVTMKYYEPSWCNFNDNNKIIELNFE